MDLSIRILIVDDMAAMRRIIKTALTDIGFTNITDADDGVKALKKLKDGSFDFIVSDWTMPKMSGLELLKTIRGMDKYKKVPFLMVTAEGQKQNVLTAIRAGVSNYLIKPFTTDQLHEKMENILK